VDLAVAQRRLGGVEEGQGEGGDGTGRARARRAVERRDGTARAAVFRMDDGRRPSTAGSKVPGGRNGEGSGLGEPGSFRADQLMLASMALTLR
jgi:hypothetical protein